MVNYSVVILLFGSFFLLLSTVLRFITTQDHTTIIIKRVQRSLFPVDIRNKGRQEFGFIFQLTGLLWIMFGILYNILLNTCEISMTLINLIKLIVGFGPLYIFGSLVFFLTRYYWENEK